MFDTIVQFLKGFFDWISWLFTEVWRQCAFALWSVWSFVLVAAGLIYSLFDFLKTMVSAIIGMIDTLVLPTFDLSCGGARRALEMANTFLPVSEFFAMLLAYLVLLGVLLGYKSLKSIKSWFWAS